MQDMIEEKRNKEIVSRNKSCSDDDDRKLSGLSSQHLCFVIFIQRLFGECVPCLEGQEPFLLAEWFVNLIMSICSY